MMKTSLSQSELLTYRTFLRHYVEFSDEEWDIFSSYLYPKVLLKKDFLFEQDTVCSEVGYILEGALRQFSLKEGDEITTYFCFQGELVTSYKSFLTGKSSASYFEALEPVKLILFNKKSFTKLLEDERICLKMERFGRLIAEELICCYEDRVFAFVTQSPEERYLQLLLNGKELIRRIPQRYLANYLGITPVSLSRIRKRILV